MFKKILLTASFFLILFIAGRNIVLAEAQENIPQLYIGQTWETFTRLKRLQNLKNDQTSPESFSEPIKVKYEVKDIVDLEGENCYLILISDNLKRNALSVNTKVKVFLRKIDLTLKKAINVVEHPNNYTIENNLINENSDFIMIKDEANSSYAILDFPNLSNTLKREIIIPGIEPITQEVEKLNNVKTKITISREKYNGKLITTQIWEKGKPWWSSIDRVFIYTDPDTGKEVTESKYSAVLEGVDKTAPELDIKILTKVLKPPDHRLVEVEILIDTSDDFDKNPEVKLESVASNEPDDVPGDNDGNTTQDIEIVDQNKVFLRAESDSRGSGRIYTLTFSATDSSGNKTTKSVNVTVPPAKPITGDLDGDGDVDQNDLNIILAARNTPATGPNDSRDLDHDGKITALDSRKLTTLCTRPRCAIQ